MSSTTHLRPLPNTLRYVYPVGYKTSMDIWTSTRVNGNSAKVNNALHETNGLCDAIGAASFAIHHEHDRRTSECTLYKSNNLQYIAVSLAKQMYDSRAYITKSRRPRRR